MGDHNRNDKLHIAMFPWLAFGHMIPFLEVAKLIAQKGHRVSFLSTPRNIQRLPKLPPNLSSFIEFVELPLPHVDNLPENAEATADLPQSMVPFLKIAYDRLQQAITEFLQTDKPDWLLNDFAAYWLPPVASNLGISNMFFSIFIASTMCYTTRPTSTLMNVQDDRTKPEHFTVPPKWFPFHSPVSFRLFEILKIFADSVEPNESGISDMLRFEMVFKGSDALALRSCYEFEPQYLQLLEQLHGKPVIPYGQLPPATGDEDDNETWRSMREWLDKQEKGSVVYVAFGSEPKLSQEEVTEIALGLELSQLPFFWVLKPRADTHLIELPDGFLDRIKGRGVVYRSWAPQLKILAHDSVGGILTHCGWGSVAEAIQYERALILFTLSTDQGLNARVLEEKKLGYSIPRNERDGSFTRNSVAESLRLVLIEDDGKIYRDKVKEYRGVFGNRDKQDLYVHNLVEFLKTHKRV